MTTTHNDEIEQRELDLTQPEDLEVFLESAEDVYADALQFEDKAKVDRYSRLNNDGVVGEEVFQTLIEKLSELQEMIGKCRDDLLPNEKLISDDFVDRMQVLYDDMLLLRNHIRDAYKVGADELINTKDFDSEEKKTILPVKTSASPVPVTESSILSDISVNKKDTLIMPVQEEFTDEREKLFAEIEKKLKEATGVVSAVSNRLDSLFPKEQRHDEATIFFTELETSSQRLTVLRDRLDDIRVKKEDLAILQSTFDKYGKVIKEVVSNIEMIEKALLARLNKSEESGQGENQTLNVGNPVEEVVSDTPTVRSINEVNESQEERPYLAGVRSRKENEEQEGVVSLNESENEDVINEEENSGFNSVGNISERSRKTMRIESDSEDEGNLKIIVAKQTEFDSVKESKIEQKTIPEVKTEPDIKPRPLIQSPLPQFSNSVPVVVNEGSDGGVVAKIEKNDPLNRMVPNRLPTIIRSDSVHEQNSLTKKYLNSPSYLQFIKSNYSSINAFERMLDTEVTQFEAKTTDTFERWLGEKYDSAFAFLQNKTLDEIDSLYSRTDTRDILAKQNVKYDMFIAWVDLIEEMRSVLPSRNDMSLGELYAIWMIETEIAYYNGQQ